MASLLVAGWRVFAFLFAVGIFASPSLHAVEIIPPKPAGYFNDDAGVVSREVGLRFNEQLAQFERETSNQVVVAVFRNMETNSSVEDYTQRVAEAWGVGKKDRKNGAVLFVFINARKMYIQVGYGLEGVLPDATAFDITERKIKPFFKRNDYAGGLATGIDFIFKAIRGEYTGDGKTNLERTSGKVGGGHILAFVVIGIMILAVISNLRLRRRGYGYTGMGGPFVGGWSGGGSSWSSGSSDGGSSGFSGGGGSFGGGGAGSSW